jgi:alcohol dehydrogenase
MSQSTTFQLHTRLVFGEGSLQRTGELAKSCGLTHALIVTDAGMVATGIIGAVQQSLHAAGLESSLFADVESDPGKDTVGRAVEVYMREDCDSIIAVGGGSPIDCAKAAGVVVSNPGQLEDYFGIGKVTWPLPVLFAIPTTVGTGSEVTSFAVISDTERHKKMVIGSPLVTPHTAILDPQVVATLPAHLVAATGMDAMAHAIESVLSVFATPFSDALALQAISMVHEYIIAAVCLNDPFARGQLLFASSLAGYAFSNARTGLVHGMAHPVGSYHHVHHGLAIAVLLPYILKFNQPCCSEKLELIAKAMDCPPQPEAAIEAVFELNARVGIPTHLSAVGVTTDFLEVMARDAFESGNAQIVNPRKPSYDEIMQLYLQAL